MGLLVPSTYLCIQSACDCGSMTLAFLLADPSQNCFSAQAQYTTLDDRNVPSRAGIFEATFATALMFDGLSTGRKAFSGFSSGSISRL